MAFGVLASAFHSQGRNAERARRGQRPAPGDSRARPAPRPAAPPAPLAPGRTGALTCAARRRRPQQQQQQQQRRRRGQQLGARTERAARFPAGVDVHAGGARGGARGDARRRGARPGRRTRRGGQDLRKSWGAGAGPFSLWQWLSGRGLRAHRPQGRRARPWPAGRPDPVRLASPRLLQLLRLPLVSPGRRRPARPVLRGRSARVRS